MSHQHVLGSHLSCHGSRLASERRLPIKKLMLVSYGFAVQSGNFAHSDAKNSTIPQQIGCAKAHPCTTKNHVVLSMSITCDPQSSANKIGLFISPAWELRKARDLSLTARNSKIGNVCKLEQAQLETAASNSQKIIQLRTSSLPSEHTWKTGVDVQTNRNRRVS